MIRYVLLVIVFIIEMANLYWNLDIPQHAQENTDLQTTERNINGTWALF